MASQYDEIINKLAEDPEFLDLSENEQDSLIDQIAQEKLKKIPNTGNFIKRAIDSAKSVASETYPAVYDFANNASFGAVDAARNADNALLHRNRPAPEAETGVGKIAQSIGGMAGLGFGGPGQVSENIGAKILPELAAKPTIQGLIARSAGRAVGGAAGGALAPGNLDERIGAAKNGAIISPIMGGVSDAFFKRQRGLDYKKGIGALLGKMKTTIGRSGQETDPLPIIGYLDNLLESNSFERGTSRGGLQAIRKTVGDIAESGRGLTPDEMVQLEEQLGRVGIFRNPLTGQPTKDVRAPRLNLGAQEGRNMVSGEVDDIASAAGVPEFGDKSREFSAMEKKFPDKKRGGIGGSIRTLLAAFGITKDPHIASIAAIADSVAENPIVKQKLYDFATSKAGKGIGNSASISMSQLLAKKKN